MIRLSALTTTLLALIVTSTVACSKGKRAPTVTTSTSHPTPAQVADDDERVAQVTVQPDRPDAGGPVSFGPIRFGFDDATLNEPARAELQRLADWLAKHPGHVTIEGHTDERGTTEYNLALGQTRADAIASYLGRLGVTSDHVSTITYGEEHPVVDGDGESAWAQNRRGELRPDR